MPTLDLKDFVPTNPLDHAANALDPLAFIAGWPKRKREARLQVVKVLRALRDMGTLPRGWDVLQAGGEEDTLDGEWAAKIDDILSYTPDDLV